MHITRRALLEGFGAMASVALAGGRLSAGKEALGEWKPGDPIGYARKQSPDFGIPPFDGDRYTAMVPDTLDLAERAEWGINVLTETTDPQADHEIYGNIFWNSSPPRMQHDFSDHGQPRYMESLPLLRIITGFKRNEHVDQKWMEVALRCIAPDGLAYTSLVGRPWGAVQHTGCIPDGVDVSGIAQYPDATYMGGLLSAMMIYHERDGGTFWKQTAERMVDALSKLVIDKGRYAYYSPSPHFVIPGSTDDWGRRNPMYGVGSDAVHGLIFVYRETGYEPARKLADQLLRYVLEEIQHFGPDGRFTPDYPSAAPDRAHFHGHTEFIYHALEHALLTKDQQLLDFARKAYNFAKEHGDMLLGYFPEWIDDKGDRQTYNSETCEIADMISVALLLTRSGLGDHWDEVDRWVRNQFAENQLSPSRAEWMMRYADKQDPRKLTPFETNEKLLERTIGAFTGTPRPNEYGFGAGNCCTENGTRAIYYVWESILTHQDGRLNVNLLLNRASKWADVESHVPYTGQVDVRVKEPMDLSIRIPEWVKVSDARVQIKSFKGGFGETTEDRSVTWDGRYAKVGRVKPRDVVMLTFPIAERTDSSSVLPERCKLIRKGNEVVAVAPPGQDCPLYQRDHYRVDDTRWRKVQRFVSREHLAWLVG